MAGNEDDVGFLATGSGVQQFQLSLWGSFVLPCRRFFPDLRSTTHTSSLRASAAAHSEGSPSGLTKHAQATTCRENDGSTLLNLPAGDTQRVSLKSPVGKTAARNEPRGRGKRRHDLMTVCHDARKGRNIGIHWSKPVAPPLHSTSNHEGSNVMKMKLSVVAVALLMLTLAPTPVWARQEKKLLTNADVVQLIKAGLDESTVLLAIQQGQANFDTSPTALIDLKPQGVSGMKGSVPESNNQGWQVVGLGSGLPPMARKLRSVQVSLGRTNG